MLGPLGQNSYYLSSRSFNDYLNYIGFEIDTVYQGTTVNLHDYYHAAMFRSDGPDGVRYDVGLRVVVEIPLTGVNIITEGNAGTINLPYTLG